MSRRRNKPIEPQTTMDKIRRVTGSTAFRVGLAVTAALGGTYAINRANTPPDSVEVGEIFYDQNRDISVVDGYEFSGQFREEGFYLRYTEDSSTTYLNVLKSEKLHEMGLDVRLNDESLNQLINFMKNFSYQIGMEPPMDMPINIILLANGQDSLSIEMGEGVAAKTNLTFNMETRGHSAGTPATIIIDVGLLQQENERRPVSLSHFVTEALTDELGNAFTGFKAVNPAQSEAASIAAHIVVNAMNEKIPDEEYDQYVQNQIDIFGEIYTEVGTEEVPIMVPQLEVYHAAQEMMPDIVEKPPIEIIND